MNDEQSKRVAEAAEALIQANDSLEEARDALRADRFERDSERERANAAQQLTSRIDAAGRRVEEALRRAAISSAALGRSGAWAPYRSAVGGVREARASVRGPADPSEVDARRAAGELAVARLDEGLSVAAGMVFGEGAEQGAGAA
jgi:hypothetical protein